jgi:hypothetical protein
MSFIVIAKPNFHSQPPQTQQNHPHQLFIKTNMQLITNTTYKAHIQKVRAHNYIQGYEIVDNLSKKKEDPPSSYSPLFPLYIQPTPPFIGDDPHVEC